MSALTTTNIIVDDLNNKSMNKNITILLHLFLLFFCQDCWQIIQRGRTGGGFEKLGIEQLSAFP